MFKNVFLAVALLAPAVAYGGTPSTDLSVQIVPSTSMTPPPPSPTPSPPPTDPTPPAAAQAAGFTTLAANYDFTGQTSDGVHPANWYQTLSNWLDCAGASNPVWQNVGINQTTSCEYRIINDNGTAVLDMGFTTTDFSNGFAETQMQQCDSGGSNCSVTFPQGKYVEIVSRVTPGTSSAYPANGFGVIYDDPLWSWPSAATGGQEWDFVEMYSGGTVGGQTACCGGTPANSIISGYNPNAYNTYGFLYTSDGTSDSAACIYTNGQAVNGGGSSACNNFGNIGSGDFNARNFLLSTLGPQGTSNGAPANNMDLYIQRIRVWECAGWASGQCNGTVFTSAP